MDRGELDLAQRLDEDLLRLSRQRNDAAGLVLGHYSSGRNLMLAGRFALIPRRIWKRCLRFMIRSPTARLSIRPESTPTSTHRHSWGSSFSVSAFPTRHWHGATRQSTEARRLAHPPSLAASLASGARLLSLVGDNAALDERADQLVAVATEQGFPLWRAQGTIYRGWVKVKNGDVAEGISLLRSGSTAYRATGAAVWMPYYIALLARACEIAGQIEEAA